MDGGNANLITSVAPCDQSRTEKVSLGSLGGFQLGCGSGMVCGGEYICHYTRITVLELKTWDSERVPSCAAPHAVKHVGRPKVLRFLEESCK